MAYCSSCGKKIDDDANSCVYCGSRQIQISSVDQDQRGYSNKFDSPLKNASIKDQGVSGMNEKKHFSKRNLRIKTLIYSTLILTLLIIGLILIRRLLTSEVKDLETSEFVNLEIINNVDSISYAFGIINYESLKKQNLDLNPFLVAKAIRDSEEGRPLMSNEIARTILIEISLYQESLKTNKITNNETYRKGSINGASIRTKTDSLSYAFGILNYYSLKQDNLIINQLFAKALMDSKEGKTLFDFNSAENIIGIFINQSLNSKIEERQKNSAENKTKSEGEQFLMKNRERLGVNVTESGLQYEVITLGSGPKPNINDIVRINYTGKLIDDTVFDSTQGKEPVSLPVNGVIPGFMEALQLMPVGSKYLFYLPSNLAYGEQGAGRYIKPYSVIIYEIELIEII